MFMFIKANCFRKANSSPKKDWWNSFDLIKVAGPLAATLPLKGMIKSIGSSGIKPSSYL